MSSGGVVFLIVSVLGLDLDIDLDLDLVSAFGESHFFLVFLGLVT